MPKAFYAEQTVVVDGEAIKLAIDFRAIDATEQLLDRSYDEILDSIQSPSARTGDTVKVLWGLLRKHHPEMSLDEVTTLTYGEAGTAIGLAMIELLAAAFPPAEKEKAENPLEPHGALSPS